MATSPKSKKKSETEHEHAHEHEHEQDDEKKAKKGAAAKGEAAVAEAKARLGAAGRNDPCPCGSGKKYKKCHLAADEAATIVPPTEPDAKELLTNGWRLFEQRRPGAAEKEFKAALAADATLHDARVGIGMARLSAGNADGAKEELSAVIASGEAQMAKLAKREKKDAFDQPEYQPFIRAAHALGCLAYDEERYADAVKDLERVHAVDDGAVGIEARLIAAKALMKLEKPADAVALLEPAAKLEGGEGRANLGLALAHFAAGAEAPARGQRPLRQDAARPHPSPRRERGGRAAGIGRGGAALRADLRRRLDRRRQEVPGEGAGGAPKGGARRPRRRGRGRLAASQRGPPRES